MLGCKGKSWLHAEEGGPSPLLSTGEAAPGVLCLFLAYPGQERHGCAGETPVKGHYNDKEIEASLL